MTWRRKSTQLLAISAVFLVALLAWLAFYPILKQIDPVPNANLGAFGDSFGAFNALVSTLAFAALVITLWMQREELELQRLELAETRKELARTADQQEAIAKHQATMVEQQKELTKAQDASARNLARQRDIMREGYKAQKASALATIYQARAAVVSTRRQRDEVAESATQIDQLLEDVKALSDEP